MRFIFVVILLATISCSDRPQIMTVQGYVDADSVGRTLPHEHVLVDFIGADSVSADRYNRDSAFVVVLPHLVEFKKSGGSTLIECTPSYLGRDPVLLRELAVASGLNLVTNTGYYGAAAEKFYPDHAFVETADELAARWMREWNEGIDGTGIRPGFMKLSADNSPLTSTQEKMVRAAAITHLATGLSIAIHNGDGAAAQQELSILESHGVSPDAMIWVHAQNEKDSSIHKAMASRGVWVEFDGLHEDNVEQYVRFLVRARNESYLDKVLVSHDAGWYHVGEAKGGSYRGYLTLTGKLLPALQAESFSKDEIDLVTQKNPSQAFAVRIRRH